MATVKATRDVLNYGHRSGYRVTWAHMKAGDEGSFEELVAYPEKTITVEASPGTVKVLGRNRPDGSAYQLFDADGTPIMRDGIFRLLVNPWQLGVEVVSGDDVTITAVVLA